MNFSTELNVFIFRVLNFNELFDLHHRITDDLRYFKYIVRCI